MPLCGAPSSRRVQSLTVVTMHPNRPHFIYVRGLPSCRPPKHELGDVGEIARRAAIVETKNRLAGQDRSELDVHVLEGLEGDGPIQTAHATVTKRLRDAVLSGSIRPGTRLVQSELAKALGVSVTPVREALRDLAGEGLIDFDAFRGATVHIPTVDELHDIFDVRTHLIELSVRRGVSAITPEELAEARRLSVQMAKERDQFNWVELNRKFHQIIEGAARSPQLSLILGRLSDISTPYVNLSFDDRDEVPPALSTVTSTCPAALGGTVTSI